MKKTDKEYYDLLKEQIDNWKRINDLIQHIQFFMVFNCIILLALIITIWRNL